MARKNYRRFGGARQTDGTVHEEVDIAAPNFAWYSASTRPSMRFGLASRRILGD